MARRLAKGGFSATQIHGDRTQAQRNQALRSFSEGHHRVLVATDVAAAASDVANVAHVINFDMPKVAEDFVHRVGRTGRASAKGIASTFAGPAERGDLRKIERTLAISMKRFRVPLRRPQRRLTTTCGGADARYSLARAIAPRAGEIYLRLGSRSSRGIFTRVGSRVWSVRPGKPRDRAFRSTTVGQNAPAYAHGPNSSAQIHSRNGDSGAVPATAAWNETAVGHNSASDHDLVDIPAVCDAQAISR